MNLPTAEEINDYCAQIGYRHEGMDIGRAFRSHYKDKDLPNNWNWMEYIRRWKRRYEGTKKEITRYETKSEAAARALSRTGNVDRMQALVNVIASHISHTPEPACLSEHARYIKENNLTTEAVEAAVRRYYKVNGGTFPITFPDFKKYCKSANIKPGKPKDIGCTECLNGWKAIFINPRNTSMIHREPSKKRMVQCMSPL
jgi:hypothetical protein